jgi:hypothetical protein
MLTPSTPDVLDKEAWLKLAADWNALAEDAARRRRNG